MTRNDCDLDVLRISLFRYRKYIEKKLQSMTFFYYKNQILFHYFTFKALIWVDCEQSNYSPCDLVERRQQVHILLAEWSEFHRAHLKKNTHSFGFSPFLFLKFHRDIKNKSFMRHQVDVRSGARWIRKIISFCSKLSGPPTVPSIPWLIPPVASTTWPCGRIACPRCEQCRHRPRLCSDRLNGGISSRMITH